MLAEPLLCHDWSTGEVKQGRSIAHNDHNSLEGRGEYSIIPINDIIIIIRQRYLTLFVPSSLSDRPPPWLQSQS